jgi:hypothetical protein
MRTKCALLKHPAATTRWHQSPVDAVWLVHWVCACNKGLVVFATLNMPTAQWLCVSQKTHTAFYKNAHFTGASRRLLLKSINA